ncbi:MAG TPA: hypothetical protein VHL79_17860 [Ramlibacter sp.]|jgi:hypothetical protein|nr:hypothetical protein [Ramlibacter sp.]
MRQQNTESRVHAYTADDALDLGRDWDPSTGREGLRAYLEKERPHLLRSYDAEFLVDAVAASRQRAQAR